MEGIMKNFKSQGNVDEILLTRERLASRWGCCKETIKRMQNRGELPVIMFNGKSIRYALSDIMEIERSQRYCPQLAEKNGGSGGVNGNSNGGKCANLHGRGCASEPFPEQLEKSSARKVTDVIFYENSIGNKFCADSNGSIDDAKASNNNDRNPFEGSTPKPTYITSGGITYEIR
jgi:hypothetical protein